MNTNTFQAQLMNDLSKQPRNHNDPTLNDTA